MTYYARVSTYKNYISNEVKEVAEA